MRLMPALFAFAFLAGAPPGAAAQDRMPPIPADRLTPEQKQAIVEFQAERSSEVTGPYIPLLRSPVLLNRVRAMGDYLRFRSALPPRLSEFVILLTARRWTQQYEWNAHQPLALKGGLAKAVVEAIAAGHRPPAMAADEAALYALVDEAQNNRGVGDATYANAVAQVGEQGVVDALVITGQYTMLAMLMNTTRTPLPPGTAPALAPLPK